MTQRPNFAINFKNWTDGKKIKVCNCSWVFYENPDGSKTQSPWQFFLCHICLIFRSPVAEEKDSNCDESLLISKKPNRMMFQLKKYYFWAFYLLENNLDRESQLTSENFEFDWMCFEFDEKIFDWLQLLATIEQTSFYWWILIIKKLSFWYWRLPEVTKFSNVSGYIVEI